MTKESKEEKETAAKVEDQLWVDVVKGAIASIIFSIILVALFLTILGGGVSSILLLFIFIGLETLFLYWFVFRADGKHVFVHWPFFYAGILVGFVVTVFLITFLSVTL